MTDEMFYGTRAAKLVIYRCMFQLIKQMRISKKKKKKKKKNNNNNNNKHKKYI